MLIANDPTGIWKTAHAMADISRRTLLSRSALLAGLVVGAGLGLSRQVHHKVAVPPPAPPTALTDALARQQSLLAGYAAVAGAPAGLQADVSAHGVAIRALLENYPGWRLAQQTPATSAIPAPGVAVPHTRAELATSSRTMAKFLVVAVQTWSTDDAEAAAVVPTLASIAASLTTHAQVLA